MRCTRQSRIDLKLALVEGTHTPRPWNGPKLTLVVAQSGWISPSPEDEKKSLTHGGRSVAVNTPGRDPGSASSNLVGHPEMGRCCNGNLLGCVPSDLGSIPSLPSKELNMSEECLEDKCDNWWLRLWCSTECRRIAIQNAAQAGGKPSENPR